MSILPSSVGLTLDTFTSRPLAQHRRSKHQFYAPSLQHHPGRRVSDPVSCTCSGSHIVQPMSSGLVDNLSPASEIPSRRSSKYAIFSPIRHWKSSTRFKSLSSVEESVAEAHDTFSFQYYMPQISSSSTDFYTDVSWVASGLLEPEDAQIHEMPLEDLDLPHVQEDDFNYYPQLSPRVHGPYTALSDGSPVPGESLSDSEPDKKPNPVDDHGQGKFCFGRSLTEALKMMKFRLA